MFRQFPIVLCATRLAVALVVLTAATLVPTDAAGPTSAAPLALPAPVCSVPAELARLDQPLIRSARRLAAGLPITIVAIGSSSTAGAGASSPARNYPNRLGAALTKLLPDHPIEVLNRGVNGEETADMMARLDRDVLAEQPDIVLWQ